jgi:putative component of membrane protein insertase Oxa1/YidC/SpoIIIJ protein YidD
MRWVRRLLSLGIVVAVAWDLSRPPSAQWSTSVALASVRVYRSSLSPHVGDAGVRCRFTLSCSRYAEVVIGRDGIVRGGWLAFKRLLRCGPWTPMGTVDDP